MQTDSAFPKETRKWWNRVWYRTKCSYCNFLDGEDHKQNHQKQRNKGKIQTKIQRTISLILFTNEQQIYEREASSTRQHLKISTSNHSRVPGSNSFFFFFLIFYWQALTLNILKKNGIFSFAFCQLISRTLVWVFMEYREHVLMLHEWKKFETVFFLFDFWWKIYLYNLQSSIVSPYSWPTWNAVFTTCTQSATN